MRKTVLTLMVLALAGPALASGGGKKKSSSGPSNRIKADWSIKNEVFPETAMPDQAQSTHSVDIPVVVVPISIDERLVNYAFVSIRVVLDKSVDAWKMRTSSHFMRDAVVRASHKHAFGKKGMRTELDKERAIQIVRQAILPWVNEEQIDHIEFLSVDMLNG